MKPTPFEYPKNAAVGKVVHKNRIYKQAGLTPATKKLFIRQVEQIVWEFKLAPETVNIKSTIAVPEIQIFSISLKTGELNSNVLRCIDLAIPFPIIFELRFDDKLRLAASYKRPSDADATKSILSDYFFGEWIPYESPRKPLPIVFDLEILYSQILAPLFPYVLESDESLIELVERMESIRRLKRDIERCSAKLQKEKQFNRKVEINAALRKLTHDLEVLMGTSRPTDSGIST